MRSQSLTAEPGKSTDPFTPAISDRDEALARISAASRALREELAACSATGKGAARDILRLAVRGLAREILRAPRPNRRDPWVGEVLGFIKRIEEAGGRDLPAGSDALTMARESVAKGWVGLIAAMLQVPSWQLPGAPAFDAVPDWLWGDYAAWLFNAPVRFTDPSPADVTQGRVQHVGDLERWVGRNSGSFSVRTAVAAYLDALASTSFSRGGFLSWRPEAESRGRILTRSHLGGRPVYDPPIAPRHGRRLRVGFIGQDFGPRLETYELLPCFEQLDPRGFDVFLFPLQASDSPEAAWCSRRARATQVLPPADSDRLEVLRNSQLDVVVFSGDLGRDWNDVTKLALHRVAPLQVVNHRSGFTTGLPEIDLYISGHELTAACPAVAFTERVGVLRGPARSFAFAGNDTAASAAIVTREDLGLPHGGAIFATVVDAAGAPQVMLQEWAGILARAEGPHLAIIVADERNGSQLPRFCSAIDRALDARGVDPTRVSIFPASPARPHEVRAVISTADIFLDADPARLAGWAVAEALRARVPVIGIRSSDGGEAAAMLGAIPLPDLIAADLASYGALASGLAADAERRAALRARISDAIEATPDFLDSLAAGDAFGALIESAFDELSSLGRTEFRRQTEPVCCFSLRDPAESLNVGLAAHARGEIETAAMEASLALRSAPADTRVRYLQGLVLHAQGNTSRSVDYLLAAVQRPDATAPMWYALALALRDNRQVGEAIQVLETCLRMDHGNVDALLTLLELAERVGATDIARDVLECLQQIASEDPRVLAMS